MAKRNTKDLDAVNLAAVLLPILSGAKSQRASVKRAAHLVKAIGLRVKELRELDLAGASSPDTIQGSLAFQRSVIALCDAAEEALRTIPPSAGKRPLDEIDRAPTPSKLNRALARAVIEAGVPASPAGVRDLMVSWGLHPEPLDNVDAVEGADKWKKALLRGKRPSRKVTGTVRRKK